MAMVAIAAVGTAIQVYSQIQAANAQSGAATQDANAKRLMAQEVQDRQNLNRETLRRQGVAMMGNQSSQYAAGNVDVGSGSPLMTMENTLAETNRKINNNQIEADFRTRMYLISSSSEDNLASQDQTSGWWKGAGTLITAGGAAGKGQIYSPGGGGTPNPLSGSEIATMDTGGSTYSGLGMKA